MGDHSQESHNHLSVMISFMKGGGMGLRALNVAVGVGEVSLRKGQVPGPEG